jgi:hypothetical protein
VSRLPVVEAALAGETLAKLSERTKERESDGGVRPSNSSALSGPAGRRQLGDSTLRSITGPPLVPSYPTWRKGALLPLARIHPSLPHLTAHISLLSQRERDRQSE